MVRWNRRLSIVAIGLALGVAAPMVPARAAGAPAGQKVRRDALPAAVDQTFQQRLPPGAEVTEFLRRGPAGNEVYVAHYKNKGGGGEHKIFVGSAGQFLLGPLPLDQKVTEAELDRAIAASGAVQPGLAPAVQPAIGAPAPAAGTVTPEQARVEIQRQDVEENRQQVELDRLNTEIGRLDQRIRDAEARARRGDRNAAAERDQYVTKQRELIADRDRRNVEITRIEQRKRDVAAAAGIAYTEPQVAAARLPENPAEIETASGQAPQVILVQQRDVPQAVLQAFDRQTRGMSDVEYRRETQGGQVSYLAHWVTPDNRRYWMQADQNGGIIREPMLSIHQPRARAGGAGLAAGNVPAAGAAGQLYDQDRDDAARDARFSRVGGDQVPPAVRDSLEKYTRGQRDVEYRRDVEGSKVYYTAHYVTNDGNRHWVTVNENGTVRAGPKISQYQGAGGEARPAAAREPAPVAHEPAPVGRAPAQNANTLTPVDSKNVPKPVVTTVLREANNQGGHDWEYFRVGQNDYVVRYMTKDNKRMETRIDASGKVVEAPRPAR